MQLIGLLGKLDMKVCAEFSWLRLWYSSILLWRG